MRIVFSEVKTRGFSIGASLVLVPGTDWEFCFVLMVANRIIKLGAAAA